MLALDTWHLRKRSNHITIFLPAYEVTVVNHGLLVMAGNKEGEKQKRRGLVKRKIGEHERLFSV